MTIIVYLYNMTSLMHISMRTELLLHGICAPMTYQTEQRIYLLLSLNMQMVSHHEFMLMQ